MNIITRKKLNEKNHALYNLDQPYKNPCTSAIAEHLGFLGEARYLQLLKDIVYNARKKFTVRRRNSKFKLPNTIGQIRAIASSKPEEGVIYYLIYVEGHVLLLDSTGKTVVDTDPRKRDRRKCRKIYAISKK